MRWANFLFFLTLQREIPFGNARSVNSRETFTDIVKAEIKEFLRRIDENNEKTNTTLTEETSENNFNLTENANVDDRDHKSNDHYEIKFEDIQWKRSKFRGTDFILSFPFLPPFQSVNEVSLKKTASAPWYQHEFIPTEIGRLCAELLEGFPRTHTS